MYDDNDDDCPFTAPTRTDYNDDCLIDDLQANAYDEYFDDDDDDWCLIDDNDCSFTAASHTNYGDECLVDDVDADVDDPIPSHESYPTRCTQPHPSTVSRCIESSDSQMPPSFEPPMCSGLSPDVIARLTIAELSHNPEFIKVYRRVTDLQSELLEQKSTSAELRDRTLNQARERVLEWRMRVSDT